MNAERLRELQARGRFFCEGFPGAAAAEEWLRSRKQAEPEDATRLRHLDRSNSGGDGRR